MRRIAVIALGTAVALGLSMSTSFEADAQGKKFKNKQCTATTVAGAKTSWKCKAEEKCCFDFIQQKGNCVAASAVCL